MIILAITLFFTLLFAMLFFLDLKGYAQDFVIVFFITFVCIFFVEIIMVLDNNPVPISAEYDTIEEEYYALTNYKQLIEETNNEFIRYDFYRKIEKWNNQYYTYQNNSKNPFVNIFYDFKPYKNCQPIEFNLKHADSP